MDPYVDLNGFEEHPYSHEVIADVNAILGYDLLSDIIPPEVGKANCEIPFNLEQRL